MEFFARKIRMIEQIIILIFIILFLLYIFRNSFSLRIMDSPKCNHYGEFKKYIHEADMWLCEECEEEYKKDKNDWDITIRKI